MQDRSVQDTLVNIAQKNPEHPARLLKNVAEEALWKELLGLLTVFEPPPKKCGFYMYPWL